MHQFDPESIKKYRLLLWPLGIFYRLLVFWRNFFYNIGFFVSRKLPCKVISIGNLSVGGTGKTPFVIYLAKLLKSEGLSIAVLSRGYRRKSSGTVVVSDGKTVQSNLQQGGDEPYMMAKKLMGIPIVVEENRYRGGQYICSRFNPDMILMDDAFQHRRVYRDVDIVLINSSHRQPKLLPYGFLREPIKNVGRADQVILTKTNLTPPDKNLVNMIEKYCDFIIRVDLLPESYLNCLDGSKKALREILGPVVAVSGVGDPDSFEVILEEAGLDYIHHFRHDDHADYTEMDLEAIREVYLSAEAEAIITTEKDLAKLESLNDLPAFALPVSVSISDEDEERLLDLIF